MNRPNKKYQLEVKLDAHTFEELINIARTFVDDLEYHQVSTINKREMVSGNWIATLYVDNSAPNEEEYNKQVKEYVKAKRLDK